MKKNIFFLFTLIILINYSCSPNETNQILVFSKTEGFRHESIEAGIEMFQKLGEELQITVTASEDASIMTEKNLKNYDIVVFLSTTGDIMDESQQYEFKRYMQAGGNFLGIHAAADTEYDWPWYNRLVGAYFESHPNNPNVRDATIDVLDSEHISCSHLPARWDRSDEWYNYKSIQEGLNILMNLDESSYEGGTNGENHPIAWYREFEGGKSFYTGGGHTIESFSEEGFVQHIKGAIEFLLSTKSSIDYESPAVQPAENRFQRMVYTNNLNEPMELDLLPDGRLVFIERDGAVKVTDPSNSETTIVDSVLVTSALEDGLIGMALDPNFSDNNWIYLYYSPVDVVENRLSRFQFNPDSKGDALSNEVIMLSVKTQRDECCHAAGSLEFDANGNLFIATGDNTNPHESNGYAPIDGRAGRSPFSALKSSANTNDLRGKILRITPQPDGSYTIPDGNLFPDGSEEGRPEIYVMGNRNPYRISIDRKDGRLFWGEVGPDADGNSDKYGPRGYDEVNMAKAAGNYGWPMFIADNKPYRQRDFAKDETGEFFDPQNPMNQSPFNTGIENLPPAMPAMIYYPYAKSDVFPDLASGARNAMAGPVYYASDYEGNENRLPDYYDKKLFIYDWMRGWIKTVTFDGKGDYLSHESFYPSLKWDNLIDIIMSPDGNFYTLEYGKGWFSQNEEARISKLQYIAGNRAPNATLNVDKTQAAIPMVVNFDAKGSVDPDGDKLSFTWDFGDGTSGKGETIEHKYEKAGTYLARLTVTDEDGKKSENQVQLYAGNDPPTVTWEIKGNSQFFLPHLPIEYNVKISDAEDVGLGNGVDMSEAVISVDFVEEGLDMIGPALGHQAMAELGQSNVGLSLINKSDCLSCHKTNGKSIGPSYVDIAAKYATTSKAEIYLAEKIIKGGGGVWGETAMAAHPDLSESDARKMAAFIIGLGNNSENLEKIPASGTYTFDKNPSEFPKGSYVLTASYMDKGAPGAERIMAKDIRVLRSPYVISSEASSIENGSIFKLKAGQYPGLENDLELLIPEHEAVVVYAAIDFTGLSNLDIAYTASERFSGGGKVKVLLDNQDSTPIGEYPITFSDGRKPNIISVNLNNTSGIHDLILVFEANDDTKSVGSILSLNFS